MSPRFVSRSPLLRRARRGFRGYPVATVAWYGPDDQHATKVVVSIVASENAEPDPLERWIVAEGDVRWDHGIQHALLGFLARHGAKSVVIADGLLGCPHEEGIDYPLDAVCPLCPFWAARDRWTPA